MATSAPGAAADSDPAAGRESAARPRQPRRRPGKRLSAQQRRAELLEAAVVEFAERGYHATRTADIAARAGVSQPYVYALFPDKRALFLACHDWTTGRIKEAMEKASADAAKDENLDRVFGRAYQSLLGTHPHQVLFQVQAHAAATADPVIREPVRERFIELIELSERLHGAPREVVLSHVARVMLGNVALALELPPEYRFAG